MTRRRDFPSRPVRPARFLLLAPLLLGGCLPSLRGAPSPPPEAVEPAGLDALTTEPLSGVQWGILLVDAADGRVLYARDAHRRFIPASNRKLATTIAALHRFGPDPHWETALHGPPPDEDGTVRGDLALASGGDPTLSPPFHPSAEAALDLLADRLVAAGVRRVTGDLVLESSRWDTTATPGSWMVEDLPTRSGAPPAAFAVNAAEIALSLRGGDAPGDPVLLHWGPTGDSLHLENALRTRSRDSMTTAGEIRAIHLPDEGRILLSGTVAAGSDTTLRIASREAEREGLALLHRRLALHGIEIDGGIRIAHDRSDEVARRCHPDPLPLPAPAAEQGGRIGAGCPGLPRLAGLRSPPLSAVVRAILGPSQNWMAEQLLRALGEEGEGFASVESGLRVEREILLSATGTDSLAVLGRDGSGLSTQNLMTPEGVVALLASAAGTPWKEEFLLALPGPGEVGGTLENRLLPLRGRLRAKTGSLTHVNALSGFLETSSGRTLLFSILTNGSALPASEMRKAIDAIVMGWSEL